MSYKKIAEELDTAFESMKQGLIKDFFGGIDPYTKPLKSCDCGALKTRNPNLHVSWCSTNEV